MTRAGPWLFALAVFVIHAISPLHTQTDSQWSIPVALSLLHHGDATLDEYQRALELSQHGVDERGGHFYNTFPLGPSLVALPFVALAELVPSERWQTHAHAEAELKVAFFDTTEVLVGSVCVALSTALMLLIIRARATHRLTPWLGAFVLAFASPAWSTASRGLWQHAPAMLFLTLALWAWLGARPLVLGLSLAAAFTCRPTTAIPIVVIAVAMVASREQRRRLGWVTLGALVVGLPWLAMNRSMWGEWLAPYYLPSRLETSGSLFFEALLGNLFSAGRGLLIFCPVIILIFRPGARGAGTPGESRGHPFRPEPVEGATSSELGSVHQALSVHGHASTGSARTGFALDSNFNQPSPGDRGYPKTTAVCFTVLLLHWVAISRFPHWWAGHSFGPRLFTELTPFWVLLLVPWLDSLFSQKRWLRAPGLITAALIICTVSIHARGALSKRPWLWNTVPVNIDDSPARVWDFGDLQFLR